MIQVQKKGPVFNLHAGDSSYVVVIFDGRHVTHGYWGRRLSKVDPRHFVAAGFRPHSISTPVRPETAKDYGGFWMPRSDLPRGTTGPGGGSAAISPEGLSMEYPVSGIGDLREAALRVRRAAGSATGVLVYKNYEVLKGIHGPEGLPFISSPPGECDTLRIDMEDEVAEVEVSLFYLPLPHLPVVLRWTRIINASDRSMELEQAASASLDLPRNEADILTLNGAWGRERHFHRRPACPGVQIVESRGGISSHQHAPFIALADREATERCGVVRAASLIYSGNHRHLVEQDQYGVLRLQCGINPNGFGYTLAPGDSFDTPAAALALSDSGISGISDAYHAFVRTSLLPAQWRDRDRPIVVNTWEAHYFDVNADKVAALAEEGKKIGGEVLVLDDGWFVNRRDDRRALGDWTPDPEKFPGGLVETVRRVKELGMEFGLWVEPEMVNPESELFRRHPEWILSASGRKPALARNQLVLDLGKEEVVDYLLDVFSELFTSIPIAYVKWDMNRYMVETENPEALHNHMLGLYSLWSTLSKRFPTILFEGCAGGGGRFDFGSLAYMPQFWTSDQTDALERQSIQFGTSLLFPPETMGAHVSAVPNHQVGRTTPPQTRGLTALCFNFGYELNLAEETEEDRSVYRRLSELYKTYRPLFRTGRFLRLLPEHHHCSNVSSYQIRHNAYAWAVIAPDRILAFVFYFQSFAIANDPGRWLKVWGLEEDASYRDVERDMIFESNFISSRGFWIPPMAGDHRASYWILEKI